MTESCNACGPLLVSSSASSFSGELVQLGYLLNASAIKFFNPSGYMFFRVISAELGWAGLGWAGLGWAELAWPGLAWPGMAWTRLD